VRAVAPFLAGSSGMTPRAFIPWSLLGTAAWSATFVLVGYAFSDSFSSAGHTITHGALGLAVLASAVLLWRGRRAARAAA
jgi:membrane protein DedA with SNARE-associated domain